MPPTSPPSRLSPRMIALLLGASVLGIGGGTFVMARPTGPALDPTAPTVDLAKPAPVVDAAPVAPVEPPAPVAPVVEPVAASSASWAGIPVTVQCPAGNEASLRAACPEYFTSGWKAAAERDGYSTGSQKLAKVDCGFAHLDQLDAVTRESLTCRDGLNAAIYGQDGKGGGACAADLRTYCRNVHPTPGSNPTDLCLQAVVEDGDPATVLSDACAQAVANHAWNEAATKAR